MIHSSDSPANFAALEWDERMVDLVEVCAIDGFLTDVPDPLSGGMPIIVTAYGDTLIVRCGDDPQVFRHPGPLRDCLVEVGALDLSNIDERISDLIKPDIPLSVDSRAQLHPATQSSRRFASRMERPVNGGMRSPCDSRVSRHLGADGPHRREVEAAFAEIYESLDLTHLPNRDREIVVAIAVGQGIVTRDDLAILNEVI